MRAAASKVAATKPGYVPANSLSRALALIGDRWSILILAAAFQGTRRFDDWRTGIGIASNILANRLEWLVKIGCLRKVSVTEGARRKEYRLTTMGADVYSAALMFWRFDRLWSRRRAGQPATLTHTRCGQLMNPVCVCANCHMPVRAYNVTYRDGPGAGFDRASSSKRRRRAASTLDERASGYLLIGESIDVIGDRWTQEVLSSLYLGAHRFEEIRARCGVAPNILSARLKLLVRNGMLQQRVCATSPQHHEYVLTPKGLDVYPMLLMLMKWGDRWLAGSAGPPHILTCKHCDSVLDPVVRCDQCGGDLDPQQVTFRRR